MGEAPIFRGTGRRGSLWMALSCFALRHSLVDGCRPSAGDDGGLSLIVLGPLGLAGQRPSSSDCGRGSGLFEAGRRRSKAMDGAETDVRRRGSERRWSCARRSKLIRLAGRSTMPRREARRCDVKVWDVLVRCAGE